MSITARILSGNRQSESVEAMVCDCGKEVGTITLHAKRYLRRDFVEFVQWGRWTDWTDHSFRDWGMPWGGAIGRPSAAVEAVNLALDGPAVRFRPASGRPGDWQGGECSGGQWLPLTAHYPGCAGKYLAGDALRKLRPVE